MYNEITTAEYTSADKSEVKITYQDGDYEYWPVRKPHKQLGLWLDGKTLDYAEREEYFNNYPLIMSYEDRAAAYNPENCQKVFDTCKSEGGENCQENYETCMVKPRPPKGYNTLFECDESIAQHQKWQQNKTTWEADPENAGQEYPIKEPQVLLRPNDLQVPTQPEPVTPNNIQDYVESKQKQRSRINDERDKHFENLQVEYNGVLIDAHEKARAELNSAVTNILVSRGAGFPDGTIIWTCADDTDQEFTYNEIIEIAQLALVAYTAIHVQAREAKKAL